MMQGVILQVSPEDFQKLITTSVESVLQKFNLERQQSAQSEVELLSRKQTALFLGISLPTLSKLVRNGNLPCIRCGNTLRFSKEDVISSFKKLRERRVV